MEAIIYTSRMLVEKFGMNIYNYPGLETPYNASSPAPTTIDDVKWTPTWDTSTKKSNIYTSSSPQNYPSGEWTAITLTKITNSSDTKQSRGPVTIVDYPSSSNSYTAKIFLDDVSAGTFYPGAAWYVFELTWEAPDPGLPLEIIAIVVVVVAAIAVLLFFFLRRRRKSLSPYRLSRASLSLRSSSLPNPSSSRHHSLVSNT